MNSDRMVFVSAGGRTLGAFAESASVVSKDHGALYLPALRVFPDVVRQVAGGATLFHLLRNAALLPLGVVVNDERIACAPKWSYVWGDLQVFESGEPEIKRALFLRGTVDYPDLMTVQRYLREVEKPVASSL